MLELYQAEWCPACRRVRQRLTELGVDYVARQVPVERDARSAMRQAIGFDAIPALRLGNGSTVVSEDDILVFLDEHVVEPVDGDAHRQRAERARRRYLEEECACV